MWNFDEIYNAYFRDVYRYALSLTRDENTAEEITEETFVRSMVSLGSFRGDCDIRVWLCRIAKNCWLNERKKQERLTGDELSENVADGGRDMDEALTDRESAFDIHRALHGLAEPYKEVFSLRVFGELSFRQIGELFEKSEHRACVTYHRAKEKIQSRLGMGGRNER